MSVKRAREHVRAPGGDTAPDTGRQVIVDCRTCRIAPPAGRGTREVVRNGGRQGVVRSTACDHV
jgi:hypothetical protein